MGLRITSPSMYFWYKIIVIKFFWTIGVATPEPDPTWLANPNRNPGDARSKSLIKSLFIFRVIKFLFSKVSRLETPT